MLAAFHQEEASRVHSENDNLLYYYEKTSEEIINENTFAWIEFPEAFSIGAKKIIPDGSKV